MSTCTPTCSSNCLAASMMYTCIATPIYFRALLRRALPPERHYLAPRVSLLSACIYMSFLSWQAGKFGMPGGFTMSIAFMCTGGLAVAVVLFVQTMKHTVSSIRGHIDLAYLFFAAPFITRAVAQGSTLIAVELSARMSDVNTFLVPPAFALFMSILTIVLTEAVPLVFPRDPDMWMCLFFRVRLYYFHIF
ncbi:hypothetical protein BC828DRAFT_157645 [Blastocladiella britannica]|nr:hypothetical protein BC828DRAFT_157645 [Blastocladiella britannica]